MDFPRFFKGFLATTMVASIAAQALPAFANDTSRIEPLQQHTYDKWAGIPDAFTLKGQIVDDEGNPVTGARIFVDGKELAKSVKNGVFQIDDRLTPSTQLLIRHKWHTPRRVHAGSLYNGDGVKTYIEIIPYTERFNVTPAGGIYQSGELTLEVPAGAVSEPITIFAATLPLEYGYNHDGNIEPVRLTSVDLVPHGLKFAKPVTLTMTIAREDIAEVTDPISFYYDEDQERFVRDPEGSVEVKGHRAAITLSHFSPHSTADGKLAQSTQELGRGSDIDGDGRITPSDALFMLLAAGGTQEANGTLSQPVSGTVMEMRGPSKSGLSSAAPLRDDIIFGFKDSRFSVSAALTRAGARDIAERYSIDRRWETTVSASMDVAAGEYEFDCKLLLGRYEFHRAIRWERVAPRPGQLAAIGRAWANHNRGKATDRFAFFKWHGAEKHYAAEVLSGERTIAVTMGNEGLEIYVEGQGHILARLRDTITGPCPNEMEPNLWASADRSVKGVRGRKARRAAMAESFHFGSGENKAPLSQAWGTLAREDLKTRSDVSCGNSRTRVWNYEVTREDNELVTGQVTSKDGYRIWNTSPNESRSATGSGTGRIEWSIINDHKNHFAEHLTAGLFKKTPDGTLPFGFMLHRTGERSCDPVSPPPGPDPDEPSITEPAAASPTSVASHIE